MLLWGQLPPSQLPEERPWAGTGCLGSRRSAAGNWGQGWRGKKAFLELGSRKKTQAGRCPSNQVPGLLSILCKAGSPPGCSKTSSLPSKGVGWDGATSQGFLSCSRISLGPVPAIQPFMLHLRIVWPPGSGWTERGRESWRWVPLGFPGGTSGKEPICHCRRHKRHGFYAWVGKIPWRRAWKTTPVFLPGKFHGQRSLAGYI